MQLVQVRRQQVVQWMELRRCSKLFMRWRWLPYYTRCKALAHSHLHLVPKGHKCTPQAGDLSAASNTPSTPSRSSLALNSAGGGSGSHVHNQNINKRRSKPRSEKERRRQIEANSHSAQAWVQKRMPPAASGVTTEETEAEARESACFSSRNSSNIGATMESSMGSWSGSDGARRSRRKARASPCRSGRSPLLPQNDKQHHESKLRQTSGNKAQSVDAWKPC